jgi:predicted lipoprotein with Yx(FWY)xxD motif
MRRSVALLLILLPALATACGSGGSEGTSKGTSTGTSNATVVGTRQADNNLVLVDASNHTLYVFTGKSCDGSCADVWHPFVAKGDVVEAKKGSTLDKSLLGTTKRGDGALQVTYDDDPLYVYAQEAAGETQGNGMSSFGGVWRAARADNPFERQTTTGVSCEPNCGY